MDDKVRQVGELPRSTRACDTKCDGLLDYKVQHIGGLPRSTRACDTKCDGCWITKCDALVDYQGPQEPVTQIAVGVGLQSATHWLITKVHKSL